MPVAEPVTTLPPDYREVYHLSIKQPLVWLPVLLLTIVAVLICGALSFTLLAAYEASGAPLAIVDVPEGAASLVGMALLLGVLPLHEWVHGQVIRRCGHRPRYGVTWYALFTTAENAYFRRDEYLRVLLAPLWAITLVGLALLWWTSVEMSQWIALAVLVNASGAGGDLWMAWVVRRFGPEALVRDEKDGMRIFMPERSSHSP